MSIDLSGFSISPGVVLGAGLYAAVSFVGTGPMVGEREIARLNWPILCEAEVRAEISASATPPPVSVVPETDCASMVDSPLLDIFGNVTHELKRLCHEFDNPDLGGPALRAAREQERRLQDVQEQQIARATSRASSRCECAALLYQTNNRVPLALYAGSARTITPPQVRRLTSELTRALRSPQCVAG